MKSLYFCLIGCFIFVNLPLAHSQVDFYADDQIQEIRIYFEQSNWDYLLDSLYVDGNKERLLCHLEINGTSLDSVGIRYKGFSSVSTSRVKNPFNIKLDWIINDQEYDGIDKIKLGNVIQDPSFLREVLSYDIGRKYLPSARANYANVYINDVLWGLYTNVEAVNKEFISSHYGATDNAFFKCNPEDLDFDGENSNLGNSHGTDTTDYYPYYDIESDYGWTELYKLIEILNTRIEDIEMVLNVDRTLWMHAFNYALVNFDSYVGYAQNYYLYQDDNGRFNPILWDLNQSFASYRLTDASEHFDGFSIEQAKTIDPLLHYKSISVSPRPLMRKLFENDTYRRMFLAHLRTIIEENFANEAYKARANTFIALIESSVLADSNKFYSDQDFYYNLNSTVNDLVDYPGITELMDARTDYLQNYDGYSGAPDLSILALSPSDAGIGDDVWINAQATNADQVYLSYRFESDGLFQKVEMKDDGLHNDGSANDGLFGAQIENVDRLLEYYIYAENATAGRFSPERAAYAFHQHTFDYNSGGVVINEFLTDNATVVTDEADEYDDWIELFNPTNAALDLAGLYLSDDEENLKKWPLPDFTLASNTYLIIWADNDEEQGDFHANFKLSKGGESVILSNDVNEVLDRIDFDAQEEDISFGRIPNGVGSFVSMIPTFAAKNNVLNVEESEKNTHVILFPNTADDVIYIKSSELELKAFEVYDLNGKSISKNNATLNTSLFKLQTDSFIDGLYIIKLYFDGYAESHKIIVQH